MLAIRARTEREEQSRSRPWVYPAAERLIAPEFAFALRARAGEATLEGSARVALLKRAPVNICRRRREPPRRHAELPEAACARRRLGRRGAHISLRTSRRGDSADSLGHSSASAVRLG